MFASVMGRHDRSPYRSSRRHRSRSSSRHRHHRRHRRDRSRSRSPRDYRHHRNSVLASSSSSSLGSLLAANSSQKDGTPSRSERVSSVALEALSKIKAAQNRGADESGSGVSGLEGALIIDSTLDKDAEQKRLELEMQKRRERVERERREKRLKQDVVTAHSKLLDGIKMRSLKKWSLEDDDDDDVPPPTVIKEDTLVKEEEDEVDPLDAYMQEVSKEAHQQVDDTTVLHLVQTPAGLIQAPGLVTNPQLGPGNNVTTKDSQKTQKKVGRGELVLDEDEQDVDMPYYPEPEERISIADALAQLQKREKLGAVDHSKIDYQPFTKDFYVEVPEIAKMTKEQVKVYRQQLENIHVRGKDCPKPIKTWVQAGVSARLLNCLKKSGFEKPTPIQCQSLPVIMSGRDMIGIAKTGSGKTLAFLVPLARHLEHQAPLEPGDGPIALLLTPTRELALQIYKEAKRLGQTCGFRCVCVYGGTGISEQIADLKRGAEVIVCTPGRMIDMLAANGGRVTNLRRTTYVVLDEADRMFDLGFEPQVMRIVDNCRPDRQTVMFSATFPRQMEVLARKALTLPIEVQVGGRSVVCSDVTQKVAVLQTEEEKVMKLLELLGIYQEEGSVLVFVEKQESADELMRVLMNYGYPCLSLHGGIDQYDRDSVITDFKKGNIRLLIATSVAARGLDVADLVLVVNYDCPNHYEDYVHRCGRTGRAGKKGTAYTFITPDQEKNSADLVKAFNASGQMVPEDLYLMFQAYKERMMMEGKKVYSGSGSGFRGKGFRFDEVEAQLASDKRRFAKAALGIEDSDDEGSGEGGSAGGVDWDSKIEDMFSSKRKVIDVAKSAAEANASTDSLDPKIAAQLELARQKANQVALRGGLGTSASKTVLGGTAAAAAGGVPNAGRTAAELAAERLNAKLGYSKSSSIANADGDDEGGSAATNNATDFVRRYEEELEINDFPQNVRWRITGRELLTHLNEYCDVGVSVRGVYIPQGKGISAASAAAAAGLVDSSDERPLYLCLEATNERSIQLAKAEIMRIIKEELVKLQSSSSLTNRGRYKVM
ncbi:ATP dependent RNA helicase DDX46 [Echinococcus multilocularis]|uniref:RNA helicase n=1 Tax=Echinococcus multilocularis TaxID=6211 RepID=A0A068YE60_ECHMU|nr:ATP dependent RNA helicase DDX46 [Echinococcus multilocularis]